MTKATVNEPAAVEAVTFYTDFYKNGLSPASTLENDGTANRRLFIAEHGLDVPVGPVRRRLDPQGEPQHRHRA